MSKSVAAGASVAVFLSAAVLAVAAVGKQIDVAAVITKAEAEAALGEPVKDAGPRNSDGTDGYYSRCSYYTEAGGKSLVLRVHQSAKGKIEAKKEFEALSASTGNKITAVRGLGDRAGYAVDERAAGGQVLLYVAKGGALITVGIGGMADDVGALDKAKGIARKILASL
jgi:hypothetical protein